MKLLYITGAALLLSACAMEAENFCRSQGVVSGHPKYEQCLSQADVMRRQFDTDRENCELEADATYPPTLYSRGSYERTPVIDRYGVVREARVFNEPDMYQNSEVDRLRGRIIGPCMGKAGWNNSKDWTAGNNKR